MTETDAPAGRPREARGGPCAETSPIEPLDPNLDALLARAPGERVLALLAELRGQDDE